MKAANKWEEIGILLGMDPRALDTLKDTHRGVCQKCLMEMLKGWLRSIQPPPTWSAIVKALNILGDEELAEYLEKKYLSADSSCRFY